MKSCQRFQISVGVVLVLSCLSPTFGLGQVPADVQAADITVDDLELLIKPLTKDELEKLAEHWRQLLKEKVSELSRVEVAAKNATDPAQKAELLEQSNTLREERVAVTDRLQAVLVALQTKGGEIAEYETYISAVSGITLDATDANAAATVVLGWLKSKEGGIRWGINIALFVLVLIAFKILAAIVAGMTSRALRVARVKMSDLLRDFVINTLRKVVFFIGIVIALSMLEVNIGPFLAAIGVVGFVVGFALQDTLGNFAAGFMILLYRPYDVGEVISAAGVTGKVDSMSLVSTTVKTPDNQTVVVPNGSIWGGVITNITGNETRRVDLTFGIGYDDDIAKAEAILTELVGEHPLVLKDPAPVIKLHELADSSVNFVCRPWAKTGDYWAVYWDLTRSVKERFDAEGVSIPFPQRDVHVHQVESA